MTTRTIIDWPLDLTVHPDTHDRVTTLGRKDRTGLARRFAFWPGCNKNTGAFTQRPHSITLHWTGAENPASRVIQTLDASDLSIHFVVEKGRIVQTADLATMCAHAGGANAYSIGIEIVCRGFASREDVVGSDLRDRDELDWNEPRDVYTDVIGGRSVRMASYGPQQRDLAMWLVESLCGLLEIPRVVPWQRVADVRRHPHAEYAIAVPADAGGNGAKAGAGASRNGPGAGGWYVPLFDRDPRRHGRAKTWRGVMGHFHVHEDKMDPGTELLLALWSEGFNPADERTYVRAA